jgi:hypothetical protein
VLTVYETTKLFHKRKRPHTNFWTGLPAYMYNVKIPLSLTDAIIQYNLRTMKIPGLPKEFSFLFEAMGNV